MDLRKIVHELTLEKQRLDEAIEALERLSNGNSRRKHSLDKSGSRLQAKQESNGVLDPSSPILPNQFAGG